MSSYTNLVSTMTDKLIKRLSNSLSQEELDNGWTEDSRQAMLMFFETLRSDLRSGLDVSEKLEYRSIARGMDHWGISDGQLLNDATEISSEIRKLYS